MEVLRTYSNLAERQYHVAELEGQGFRMLHDDFDPDWKTGDEPHGTLTFTNELPPQAPVVEPLVFSSSPPGIAIGERLSNIEDFLKEAFPA